MNASLYIHVPFCKRLCGYCDFYKSISLSHKTDYLDAAMGEMARRRGFLEGTQLKTIYFGGGTPSVLSADEIGSILNFARRLWDCSAVEEITVEANPDDLTPDYLDALVQTGCNRLSIGIQSFIDRDLEQMNRRHTAAEAVGAVRNARAAGFDNISIDLIYGLPQMSLEEWRSNLNRAVDLAPEHISAYHLTVEPNTLFAKRGVKPVDEELSEAEYLMLHELLSTAGYEHYEISNFALPARRSRHNSAYWKGEPYLGIGPAAHSYDGRNCRSWNPASIERYIAGEEVDKEELTDDQRREEYIMVRLRTAEGIGLGAFELQFGAAAKARLLVGAERYLATGELLLADGRLRFDERHWLVSDSVIADLFD